MLGSVKKAFCLIVIASFALCNISVMPEFVINNFSVDFFWVFVAAWTFPLVAESRGQLLGL